MNERRLARLQEQIKQRLAEVLQREIADPKLGLVTITRIELDTEFTRCKAFWSIITSTGNEKHAQTDSAAVLDRARGFCQREMARVLHTRSIPRLEFHFDEGIGAAERMNSLLRELREQRGPDAAVADAETTAGEASSAQQPDAQQPDPDKPDADAADGDAPGGEAPPGSEPPSNS